jgi:hypothetical protein
MALLYGWSPLRLAATLAIPTLASLSISILGTGCPVRHSCDTREPANVSCSSFQELERTD